FFRAPEIELLSCKLQRFLCRRNGFGTLRVRGFKIREAACLLFSRGHQSRNQSLHPTVQVRSFFAQIGERLMVAEERDQHRAGGLDLRVEILADSDRLACGFDGYSSQLLKRITQASFVVS